MNYYDQIKSLLICNEVYKKVKDYSKRRSEVETYYNVGRILFDAQNGEKRAKYGSNLIKEYSKRLIKELNDKKYSYRNLMNMRKFYIVFQNSKVNALRSQLSWSHYRELITLKNNDEIIYYIKLAMDNNLGYRELIKKIKNNDYNRLPNEYKDKIAKNDDVDLKDSIPNPILIRNSAKNKDIINEIALHQLITEDIASFMKELGEGYSYIDSQYRIKINDRYNYIDLLLYNIKYRCYVVIELKVTEFKSEYVGQILKYMHYINKNVKSINENDTIGIIICKRNNQFYLEYCSDERVISREYKLI